MQFCRTPLLISLVCLVMGACRLPGLGGDKAPIGQVVATVEGREITATQLNAELRGAAMPDPKSRKAAEDAALKSLIAREILAKAAQDRGVDKSPDFVVQRQRVEENLLAQALQAKLAAAVPPPTREEAERFITDHRDLFAERKVFTIDQLRLAQPADPQVVQAMRPLNTLPDIEALLTRLHLQYQRVSTSLDAVGADPKLIAAIVKLPPGEVFVFAGNGSLLVNQVRETKVVPFTGDSAVQYALGLIKSQRTQEAVSREVSDILAKAAPTIRYNKVYQPTPTPPKKPPAKAA